MFLHCSLTSSFWSLFQNWWVSETKETVALSNSMILYGVFENMEYIYSLSYTLLIARYSMYNSFLHEKKLCFNLTAFYSALLKKINIQREIAIANNKITIFNKTYGNIL